LSGVGAFCYFLLTFISNTSLFSGYILIKSTGILYVATFIVFVGGRIALKKAQHNKFQVTTILSDLAEKVEPQSIDGQSAEAEYAIEHPLVTYKDLTPESKKAFNLYYESVRCHQDGNKARAVAFCQEALRLDASLHKNAQEILSKMVVDCDLEEEGAICYWLGIHSEYLSDWRQAAEWYERAAKAYNKIGYNKRESRVHCNLGSVKMKMRDPSGMEEFEKAVVLNPKNGTAYLNIAKTYYRISYPGDEEHELALNAFADAIVADPVAYGPEVISSLREIGYTWKEDLEEITKRVENKRLSEKHNGE
jgi:tetratricopeptide (TPR) repeat protein